MVLERLYYGFIWLRKFFQLGFIRCCFCDKVNQNFCFAVLGLFLSAILIVLAGIYSSVMFSAIATVFPKNYVFIASIILILLIIILIFLLTKIIKYRIELFQISCSEAFHYPESPDYLEKKHIGIIWPHYTRLSNNEVIVDCIALLIRGFRRRGLKYKIYHIFTGDDILLPYLNPNVYELWILGHGDRGGLSFGNKGPDYIPYENLPDSPPKKNIIQLHCNYRNKLSLAEKNQSNLGFADRDLRSAIQNRCFIIKYFQNKDKSSKNNPNI